MNQTWAKQTLIRSLWVRKFLLRILTGFLASCFPYKQLDNCWKLSKQNMKWRHLPMKTKRLSSAKIRQLNDGGFALLSYLFCTKTGTLLYQKQMHNPTKHSFSYACLESQQSNNNTNTGILSILFFSQCFFLHLIPQS